MTTYYVDSVHGSDKNNGTASGQAIQSIEKLESINLKPGDTVLFAKGSVFTTTYTLTASGTAGHPITLGAYGTGDAPTFSSTADGIHASKSSYINVQDLKFSHTGEAAIYGGNVSNWNITNVTIQDTGLSTGVGGIVFKNGTNVSVTHSQFDGVHGDGVYVEKINGLTVANNSFTRLAGSAADGIQATDSSNISITGNTIDMSTSPNSSKGGVTLNGASHATLTDNTVIGGSFGFSLNGEYITATHNTLSGQNMYSWSSGILVGETAAVAHYTIEDNVFSDSKYGVSLTGVGANNPLREDIQISSNLFDKISGAALKIDRPSTGSFHDNIVTNTATESLVKGAGVGTGYLIEDTTTHTDTVTTPVVTTPVVTTPVVTTPVETPAVTTPAVTDHDTTPAVTTPAPDHVTETVTPPVTTPAPATTTPAPVTSTPATSTPVTSTPVTSTPAAAVSTGTHAPVATDDRFVFSDHGNTMTGNILSNDYDADGDNLLVRFIGSTRVDAGVQKIVGLYGTLTIDQTGQFSYTLDESKVDHATFTKGIVKESFQYKISDGSHQDTGYLSFQVSDHHDFVM